VNGVTKLRELLVRVESATGPDRELDKDISKALLGESSLTPLTSSIDAVMDLSRHIVGKRWFCLSGPHSTEGGRWSEGEPERYDAILLGSTDSYAKTPVTALCAAVIRAAIAKVEKEAAETRH
jgi:hypothetical protein